MRPVWYALAVVGPPPERWERRRWEYTQCSFTTIEITASELAEHIGSGVRDLKLDAEIARFNFAESSVQWLRLPSRQKYSSVELAWPSTTYGLTFSDRVPSAPNDYLSSMDAPSFPTFSSAFSAFFYDERVMTGVGQPPLGELRLVIANERARIARAVVGATSLDVWVDGDEVAGARLELNSATDQGTVSVEGASHHSFALAKGLGADAWIWLKNEGGYLDYRSVSGWGGVRSPGVEGAAPDDPVADLSALAAQGENTWLEYKREMPGDSRESKRRVFKTVVAFAIGAGGTLRLGVDGDDDTGQIVGLDGDVSEMQRRINDLVRSLITPPPPCTVTGHDVDGKRIVRLDVEANQGIIYALTVEANRPEYYVRRNGSTYFARPEELAALVKAASPSDPFAAGLDLG